MPWQLWSQISLNCENYLVLRSFPNEKQVVAPSQLYSTKNCGQGDFGGKITHRAQKFFSLVKERGNSLSEND